MYTITWHIRFKSVSLITKVSLKLFFKILSKELKMLIYNY